MGLDWIGLDLCVGLLYEHRFAVLIRPLALDWLKSLGVGRFERERLLIANGERRGDV